MVEAASCQESAGEEEELVAIRQPWLPNDGFCSPKHGGRMRNGRPDGASPSFVVLAYSPRPPSAPPANYKLLTGACRGDAARLAVPTLRPGFFRPRDQRFTTEQSPRQHTNSRVQAGNARMTRLLAC